SWAVLTSWPTSRSIIARLSAESRRSSATRMRHFLPARTSSSPGAGRAGAGASVTGRRTVHSLPRSGPALWASTPPPCNSTQPPHQGQPDAQAPLRPLERRGHLREHLEEVRQVLACEADARVPDGHHNLPLTPAPLPPGERGWG